MGSGRFEGFPVEGLRFLADLAQNNDRDWFKPRKSEYETLLVGPAQRLVAELGERMLAHVPGLAYDTRTSGAGSILRIYRDTRFSKDKRPYHTDVRMVLWDGPWKKMENPSFFVGISADGAHQYAGIHVFSKVLLPAYRDAVAADRSGIALEEAIAAVEADPTYRVGGQHYKRVPRGHDADHPRADLLRYNGLHVFLPHIDRDVVTSPELLDVCASQFEHTLPIHRWLATLIGGLSG
jgi:uncharacterized protein (TIGR02453 family)